MHVVDRPANVSGTNELRDSGCVAAGLCMHGALTPAQLYTGKAGSVLQARHRTTAAPGMHGSHTTSVAFG